MTDEVHILKPISFWSRPRTLKVRAILVILLAMLLASSFGCYVWYRTNYPYGWSHACDKNLYLTLRVEYAESHDGNFPAGEATPEASFSLIHGLFGMDQSHNLCGKRLNPSITKEVLDGGELLGPDTCGWNYVEGLRKDDDYRLALFWDKDGLNHNGGRLAGGGHFVTFVTGDTRHITAAEWSTFLDEQESLWAKIRATGREVQMSEDGRRPAGWKP